MLRSELRRPHSADALRIESGYTAEEAALHTPRIAVLNEKNEIVRYNGDRKPSFKIGAK